MNHGCPRVAASGIELHAGECRHEFHVREPKASRLALAMLQQHRADAAARVAGIDKERANLCGLGFWIEGGAVAVRAGVAAEQRRAKAPTAAADELSGVLDHVVSLVGQ